MLTGIGKNAFPGQPPIGAEWFGLPADHGLSQIGSEVPVHVTARADPIYTIVLLFTCEPVRTRVNIDVSQCCTCEVDL